MQILPTSTSATQNDVDAVVVGVFSDGSLNRAAGDVDQASGGLIRRLFEQKEIAAKPYELTTLWGVQGVAARGVLVVGLGEREKFDRQIAFRSASAASKGLAGKPRDRVAFYLDDGWTAEQAEAGAAGTLVGCQGQDLYRAEKKRHPFSEIQWAGRGEDPDGVLARGRILGECVNLTRRLVNEPPDNIYPKTFAKRARKVAKECGLEIEVWNRARLEKERCGSLLAVAKGSTKPARLVILRYSGGPPDGKLLAFVGKGVTFDSGGLSLKPTDSMLTMKCDMAGAATVLGAMRAIAELKLPVNVIGLMGLVENMTGGAAMKLGDVLTARNGRTIEVHNTDAEGRLVLADVLDVALERGATKIIDLATLTGACCVALGLDVAGLMANDQGWADRVAAAARSVGEPLWQLPMYPEYNEQIKSEVADIKNVGEGRWGGAITAAKFLEEFVGQTPWVHLDIAGPAFHDKPLPWTDAGGSGRFVRTLVEVARGWTG
jgi:leucyl aminopeptidase